MESILTSVKKLLGIAEGYDHFDQDIIMHINSVFMILTQLGVGPSEGFIIMDDCATWDDFITNNRILREVVKAYTGTKVRLQFDPPTSSSLANALNKMVSEYEWRINILAEMGSSESDTPSSPELNMVAVLGNAIIGSMKLGYSGG